MTRNGLRNTGIAALAAAFIAFGAQAQEAGDVSTGTPVTVEPEVGSSYTLETHGDWEIRCVTTPEGQLEPCNLYQLLKDDQGTDVAEITVFHLGRETVEAGATVIAPLETLLTQQLTMTIDGENGRRYPFSFCNTIGCFARLGFPSTDVDLLKKGAKATLMLVPATAADQRVDIDLSLIGFTAGYARVTELNIALREQAAAGAQ